MKLSVEPYNAYFIPIIFMFGAILYNNSFFQFCMTMLEPLYLTRHIQYLPLYPAIMYLNKMSQINFDLRKK